MAHFNYKCYEIKNFFGELMKKNIRLFSYVIFVILISINLFAANKTNSLMTQKIIKKITGGSSHAKSGGTLTYEYYEPNHINPITFRQTGSREILIKWVFESLLDIDVITGDDIPRLASKWAISKDGKEFIFWLNQKAKWHDGKPVTAEDVKFSFDVYSMKGSKSAFRKAQASAFSKIEILGKYKIKFTAKERLFSNFEFIIASIIMPKHLYYYKDPEKLARNIYTKFPKGSGPYSVESWKKGDKAVLVKNKNYWGKILPQNRSAYNFDKIVIKYIRDPQIAFEKLKKGDLDYMPIRIGNTELWRQTKKDKSFTSGKIRALSVSSKLQQGYGFIGFNSKSPLFKNKNVRKALAIGVNRQEMIKKSLDGLATIPKGPLFSVDNFHGGFKPISFNPVQAMKDLAKEGWTDSDGDYILDKNGKKFNFTVIVPNARIEKEMLFVQNYWQNIGVNAKVKILEYSTWRQLQDERRFDAVSNGKSRTFLARGVDPYGEWHSYNTKKGLRNYYGFSNPNVDKLIETARQEFDQRKRKQLLDKVNDIIAEEYILFQYSESKYSLHTVHNYIGMPEYKGNKWYPYQFGMKYWYRK